MKSSKFENLYEIKEPEIVKGFFRPPYPIGYLLRVLGINYPHCWAITNIKTRELLPDWNERIPGDIDIVTGNMQEKL